MMNMHFLGSDREAHVRTVFAFTSLCTALVAAPSSTARGQDTIFFPNTNRIAIRNMAAIPALELTERLHIHTIVGATGSVSFGELDSGAVVTLHHHTREQADVTLSGRMDVVLGQSTAPLPAGYGVLIPTDVSHSLVNPGPGRATAIEFHTVPRPDLVPPRPTVRFPAAGVDVPLLDARSAVVRLDSASGSTMPGRTCVVRWRRVRAPTDIHPAPTLTELFTYVVRGSAEVEAEGRTETLAQGSLMVIPAALVHARIRSLADSDVVLLMFQVQTP
jgi:mannose-6-phosphate isomerase-like protein (cupin superfamily)